jgi:uncharacterized protein (TIGR03083 family)
VIEFGAGVTRDGRGLQIACPLPDIGEQLVRHRTRLVSRLAPLDEVGWHRPTRCHLWDVADVVSHMTDTNRWVLASLAHANDPDQPLPFESFDNRVTPHQFVLEARGRTPADLLQDLRVGTEAVTRALSAASTADFPLVASPLGRYRPALLVQHLMWDSFLHARDILVPLGLDTDHADDELHAATVYALLFAGIVMGPFDEQVTADVVLHDRVERRYRLHLGGVVRIGPLGASEGSATCRLEGPTLSLLDGLAGRGRLDEVMVRGEPLAERLQIVPARLRPG